MKVIDELRRLYEAATKGRWTQTSMDGPDSRFDYVHAENAWGQLGEEVAAITSGRDADAPHIAAAHNALEALLRVAEAAHQLEEADFFYDALRDALNDPQAHVDASRAHATVERMKVARIELRAALAELEALEL